MKTLFVLNIHSFVDVITNSSTELFVGSAGSKDAMVGIVSDLYPNYKNEYDDIKLLSELTDSEIFLFLDYAYHYWSNNQQTMVNEVIKGFEFDDMYARYKFGDTWSDFHLRKDFVTENREKIIESLDPNDTMFFMFSFDDNPDWDMQERLMSVMMRFHLG